MIVFGSTLVGLAMFPDQTIEVSIIIARTLFTSPCYRLQRAATRTRHESNSSMGNHHTYDLFATTHTIHFGHAEGKRPGSLT